ncbi:MAG: hypothetical protein HYY49_12725 [Ignavibacteriales bacterium]|nr:hypothetical protein [Ignavibacteriales bacterium]
MKEHTIALSVVFVFLIACGTCLNNIVIYTPDSARYVVWASSIANFQGFYDDTVADPTRQVLHGPMYPVLLVPAALLFPHSVVASKVITVLIGGFTIVVFSLWLKGKTHPVFLAFSCAALAINPLMLVYSTQVLSDVPFLACVIALFVLLEKSGARITSGHIVGILASVTIGYFLREVGLALIITAVTWFALRKEYQRALLFFAIPSVFFLLWALRNELSVGPLDLPAAKNVEVFFMHIFTPQQASLFDELKERAWSNIQVYKDLVGMLVFLPGFVPNWYAVSSVEGPWMQFAYSYVDILRIPIIFLTLGMTAWGIIGGWKKSAVPKMTSIFLAFYAIPILFYPVNDVRFILPVLVIMLFHFTIGFSMAVQLAGEKLGARATSVLQWSVVATCMLPGVFWAADFIGNNIAYNNIHSASATLQELNQLPPHFRRPVDLAGKFIAAGSDSSAVVGTGWKELSFWLEGRKIVELNPQITVDQFDYLIRDYGIGNLMSTESALGVKEFETQMSASRRFNFQELGAVGAIHVLKVEQKQDVALQGGSTQPRGKPERNKTRDDEGSPPRAGQSNGFLAGLDLLETNPAKAESIFVELWKTKKGVATIVFQIALAKEFADSLEQASAMFKSFVTLGQAGWFLSQSLAHQEIIATLQEAKTERDPLRRAEKFQRVAVSYWELGFRKRAMEMLARSLASDANFFPSLIFGSLYALQAGDTTASREFHNKAASIEPANELVQGLTVLFQHRDSLGFNLSSIRKEGVRVGIAESYVRMGLRENAIDELLFVLSRNPKNRDALELLADIYIVKRRFAPARRALSRLLALNPDDRNALQKMDAVLEKWR